MFLDSYWTDTPSTNSSPMDLTKPNRIEVGPGEGPSTLAVIIVNTGRTDITGLKGYLALPNEFRSIPGQNGVNTTKVSIASYNAIVKPGESFPLYFSVDVLRNATVGPYVSNLEIVYSKVQEVGQVSTTLEIPFRITGKVILDATSLTQNLTTGTLNNAIIAIKNKGSADANGVIATITNLNGNTVTNLGDSSTNQQNNNIGNNEDNATSSTAQTGSQELNEINQTDSNIATLEANTFDIGKIRANELVQIRPLLYADYNAGGTIQSMNLEISYNDAYGNKKTLDTSVGLVVSPNPPESTLSIRPADNRSSLSNTSFNNGSTSEIQQLPQNNDLDSRESITISSGKIEEMKFVITNTGSSALENAILSLSSPSDSVKILGNTRWSVPLFTPGMEKEISTLVFASEDMISKPISFTIDAEYITGGKTRSDVLNLGAYVEGQIKVALYDLAINEIGGFPNLVGNLLNEGNTMAFFTRIQAENDASLTSKLENNTVSTSEAGLQNESSKLVNRVNESNAELFSILPPSQYLGDLTENSPLPFGIPINITESIPSGEYPITLKVSFKDNLRNDHIILLNDNVTFKANAQETEQNDQNILGINYNLFVLLVILLVGIILAVFFIRRRKRLQKKSKDPTTNDSMSEGDSNSTNDSLFDDET
ncbi:COG1361 S-layer family protein [Candidatus Nitrosocosmicus sp. T]